MKQQRLSLQPWFVFRYNHFDPIWRRCWDRDFVDAGRRFVSYRGLEEAWIDDAIATTRDGVSCFMVECSWVLRHYLERHPEKLNVLKNLVAEGRFELLGSGENIVDANMNHGETLARNLVLGTLWARETLGRRSTVGWHSDGFGSSAQMPQIFRQCGYSWVPSISYSRPDAPYWRGVDGSAVLVDPDAGRNEHQTSRLVEHLAVGPYPCNLKYAPCEACSGKGCVICGNRGFQSLGRAELCGPLPAPQDAQAVVLRVWGEELLPGVNVARDIAANYGNTDRICVRQGIYSDLLPHVADFLDAVDSPPKHLVSSRIENNPVLTGCYVTRIKVKQAHRLAEAALIAAETWDALLVSGKGASPLRDAWRKMTLSGFHDSITSSHIDEAYDEIHELQADITEVAHRVSAAACDGHLEKAEPTWTVFNPLGHCATSIVRLPLPDGWDYAEARIDDKAAPTYEVATIVGKPWIALLAKNLPALGANTIRLSPATSNIQTLDGKTAGDGRYTLIAGDHGIEDIAVHGIGSVTATDRYFVGELILEHDDGDVWCTRSLDRMRERLSPNARLTGISRLGSSIEFAYAGRHADLTWEQRIRLREGCPWIDIETDVDWRAESRRLRMAFGSNYPTDRGVYDVPFAVLERDRYEAASDAFGNAGGDWPALHWGGVQAPSHTFAVFNNGTPSYRVENGVVLVSVLRSPKIPHALVEPEWYSTSNIRGISDAGKHHFRHAVYIGDGHWTNNDVSRQASVFNTEFVLRPGSIESPLPQWRIDSEHVDLVTIKRAEDGNGIIARFVERSGRAGRLCLSPPAPWTHAQACNLLEDSIGADQDARALAIDVRPWEIITIRLTD